MFVKIIKSILYFGFKFVNLMKNVSLMLFFIVMTSIYPLILYKFEIDFVPVLTIPVYATSVLVGIYFTKSLNSIFYIFCDIDLFKEANERLIQERNERTETR